MQMEIRMILKGRKRLETTMKAPQEVIRMTSWMRKNPIRQLTPKAG